MNLDHIKMEILSGATEDWTALWELVSDCRKIMPGTTEEDLRVTVRNAVWELISDGLVYLCDFHFRENLCPPFRHDQIETILRDPATWGPPLTDHHPRVGATDAGMDAYFGVGAWNRPD